MIARGPVFDTGITPGVVMAAVVLWLGIYLLLALIVSTAAVVLIGPRTWQTMAGTTTIVFPTMVLAIVLGRLVGPDTPRLMIGGFLLALAVTWVQRPLLRRLAGRDIRILLLVGAGAVGGGTGFVVGLGATLLTHSTIALPFFAGFGVLLAVKAAWRELKATEPPGRGGAEDETITTGILDG